MVSLYRRSFTANSILYHLYLWVPVKNLCRLYKAFICPTFTYASSDWFPFSSPPILSPWRESKDLLPVELSQAVYHQPCYTQKHFFPYFMSPSLINLSLRLPPSFSLACLTHHNSHACLKKEPWRFFSTSHNLVPNLQLPCKPLILCPPKPPWSMPYSTSYQLLHVLVTTLLPSAMPLLFPIYLFSQIVTSLPELGFWWAGRGRSRNSY